jgi:SOS-response transcriptional repressor LexA
MLSSFPVVGGEVLTVPANRVIGSGHWVEEGTTSDDSLSQTVVIFRDSQFPDAKHLAFQYVGDSMDKAGFLDGDMVVCVDFKESGIELVDGQQVVIERNRAGLIDTSIRIVSVERDKIEFQPCSSNPAHKPIVISSKTGKVVGNPNERVDVVAIVRHLARNVR